MRELYDRLKEENERLLRQLEAPLILSTAPSRASGAPGAGRALGRGPLEAEIPGASECSRGGQGAVKPFAGT